MAQASASRPLEWANLYQQITQQILPDLVAANDDEDDPDGDPAMALAGRIAA